MPSLKKGVEIFEGWVVRKRDLLRVMEESLQRWKEGRREKDVMGSLKSEVKEKGGGGREKEIKKVDLKRVIREIEILRSLLDSVTKRE